MPRIVLALLVLVLTGGCSPTISLFGETAAQPLKEHVLEGKGAGKVLVIAVQGFIGAGSRPGLLRSRPSLLREVTAMLHKAAKDASVKAVVLAIDSPGGSVADTDMLYQELAAFKVERKAAVVAQAMSVTASGGYYLALAADEIQATPASVVGSVGTVFISPKVYGLMDKIGVEAEITKSGLYKDMGSPFRASTDEERRMTQDMIDSMNARFLELVAARRGLDRDRLAQVAKAGVFTGSQAVELGLADRVGFLKDALARAKSLAGLPAEAKVVAYRRQTYHDDTYFNTASGEWGPDAPKLLDLGVAQLGLPAQAGFYWLWPSGRGKRPMIPDSPLRPSALVRGLPQRAHPGGQARPGAGRGLRRRPQRPVPSGPGSPSPHGGPLPGVPGTGRHAAPGHRGAERPGPVRGLRAPGPGDSRAAGLRLRKPGRSPGAALPAQAPGAGAQGSPQARGNLPVRNLSRGAPGLGQAHQSRPPAGQGRVKALV